MKKIIIALISSVIVFSLMGCMPTNAEQLVNVNTADEPKADNIKATDYENNLNGLEKYLKELDYIPENVDPTEMMYNVIGAVNGSRYIFTVNSSRVIVELYEYDPDNLNSDGKRVINEVQKSGKFYVFGSDDSSDTAYEATLSDNNKYLMIYNDVSTSNDNVKRKKNVENVFKSFNGGKEPKKESSKQSSKESSKN